jgi:protocatechuate 3,4-dioxygenase beta subunit
MPAPRPSILRIAPFALILALAACDERAPSAPPSGAVPSALKVLGGDGQHGVAGARLPEELAVEVVDAAGRPMPGIAVDFAVVAGGGQLAAQTVASDEQGLARTRWTLGTVAADSQVVEARLDALAPVRLRAIVRPDAPALLALAGGGGAAGPVGAVLADSLAVTVKDRYGNPVVGLEVAWEMVSGGGALSPARTVTGAGGVSKTRWTLGPRVDSAQVAVARVAGLDSVAFTAHALTAGVPLLLSKRSGDGQRGPAGGVLADSLGVLLRMQDGRPVAGAVVAWSVPATAGTVAPAVTRTDANGMASAAWRLGNAPGLAQATVRVDEGTLTFTSLTEADAPAQAAAVSGTGGTGGVGRALADSLAVRVTDRHGNPVPGAEVAWSALAGGGAVSPARGTTGADGIARAHWTLGPAAGTPQTARALVAGLDPIDFSATATTEGVPLQLAKRGGDGQTGTVGSLLADSLGVVLRLPDGRGVANARVVWSVPAGAGTVAPAESRTDANGFAATAWRAGMTPGLAQATAAVDEGTLVFTARIEADAPARVAVVADGGGARGVGQALDSLAVRVTDAHGNPVPGAQVAWSALAGGGAITPARGATDADGITRAQWTLGPRVGEQTAHAVVPGAAPASFEATAGTAGVPLQLAKRGGDGQRGGVGSLLADSLAVVLRLPDGRGVSGARVVWEAGAGSVAPEESRTDANGAAAAAWTLGTDAGLAQATASVDEGRLIFTARAEAEPPALVSVLAGDGLTGRVGGALADSLAVRVTDAHGNPVPGAEVAWSPLTGGGAVTPALGTTDALGIARAQWTLGPRVGAQTAHAVVPGAPPASFEATAGTAGVPLQLAKRGGDGQRGGVGSLLADSLAVVLRLPDGRGVSGARVVWEAGAGSVAPGESRTDANGAAAAAWTLGMEAGLVQATASVDEGRLIFTARAEAEPPALVSILAGNGLTGPVGGALADSLAVRVTDRHGNSVAGVAVAWSQLSGGGQLQPAESTTDASGVARAQWTLGPRVGDAHTAQAVVAGLEPAAFTASGTTAGVTLLLGKRGGDGQRGPAGNLLRDSLGVVLRLPDGRGVSGARVAWSTAIGTVTPAETRTDARGRTAAVWQLGPEFGLVQATAAVDEGTLVFTALSEGAVPTRVEVVAGNGGTGPVGGILADSVAVRVVTEDGGGLWGIEVDWSVLAGGGAIHPARGMTNAQGIARAQWTLGPAAGDVHRAHATVAGLTPAALSATGTTAGVPLQLAKRGGDGQRGFVGTLLADSLGVQLRLPDGRGVSGALVTWNAASGTLSSAETRTDAAGRAAVRWRLGSTAGLTQATATVDDGVLTFTALAQIVPAAVRIVAGNGGTGGVGQPLADSLVVRVVDRDELPIPGVEVSWATTSGGGSVTPAQSTTDAQGIARARWTLGLVADSVQGARATVAGATPANFTATARTQGVALELVRRAGDGQSALLGALLPDSLVVELRTPAGQPVRNALVGWTVTGGGGSVSPAGSRTDALGRARTAWRLGGTPGPAQATATLDGGTISFSATQVAVTRTLSIVGGAGQTSTRGTILPNAVVVRVTDAAGAPVPNAEVRFVVLAGGGSIAWDGDVTTTGPNGTASAEWILGLQAGANRLAVRTPGAGEVEVAATGVDAPMLLLLYSPGLVVDLHQVPFHTSYAAMVDVEVAVVDPAGRPVWGVPVQFSPNKGEQGAQVLTGTGNGEGSGFATFFWEGWMRESDEELPALVIRFQDQGLEITTAWDGGERYYVPEPAFDGAEPYAPSTTVRLNAYVTEMNGISVPDNLPVVLFDASGWRVETVAGASVNWPLGPGTSTRTLTFCVIDTSHTCQDFSVQVQ